MGRQPWPGAWCRRVLVSVSIAAAVAGCGRKPAPADAAVEDGASPDERREIRALSDRIESSVRPANEDMAQRLQALQKVVQSGADTALADHLALEAFLPVSVNGMSRTSVTGETASAFGMSRSQARANYAGGGRELTLRISDLAAMGTLGKLADIGWKATDMLHESPDGVEKSIEVDGFRGLFRSDYRTGRSEMQVIVGQRFLVEAAGEGVEQQTLEGAIRAMRPDELAVLD